ncbi:MAG: helix-turn-helix domain-containing protein [Desulfobacteraceae bacterium]|nr:helix-turn-helix domain-containing protein [Desulfobacteraceae bacterium]
MASTFRTRKKTHFASFARQPRGIGSIGFDTFADDIRKILIEVRDTRVDGSELRSHVVARVQGYSFELSFSEGAISELFLELCDLMLDGRLARLPEDALRVYLAVLAYAEAVEADLHQDFETLAELTGLPGPSAVKAALLHLETEGYIGAPDDSSLPGKNPSRGNDSEDEVSEESSFAP